MYFDGGRGLIKKRKFKMSIKIPSIQKRWNLKKWQICPKSKLGKGGWTISRNHKKVNFYSNNFTSSMILTQNCAPHAISSWKLIYLKHFILVNALSCISNHWASKVVVNYAPSEIYKCFLKKIKNLPFCFLSPLCNHFTNKSHRTDRA